MEHFEFKDARLFLKKPKKTPQNKDFDANLMALALMLYNMNKHQYIYVFKKIEFIYILGIKYSLIEQE